MVIVRCTTILPLLFSLLLLLGMATDDSQNAAGFWGEYTCDIPTWTLRNMLEHIAEEHPVCARARCWGGWVNSWVNSWLFSAGHRLHPADGRLPRPRHVVPVQGIQPRHLRGRRRHRQGGLRRRSRIPKHRKSRSIPRKHVIKLILKSFPPLANEVQVMYCA